MHQIACRRKKMSHFRLLVTDFVYCRYCQYLVLMAHIFGYLALSLCWPTWRESMCDFSHFAHPGKSEMMKESDSKCYMDGRKEKSLHREGNGTLSSIQNFALASMSLQTKNDNGVNRKPWHQLNGTCLIILFLLIILPILYDKKERKRVYMSICSSICCFVCLVPQKEVCGWTKNWQKRGAPCQKQLSEAMQAVASFPSGIGGEENQFEN